MAKRSHPRRGSMAFSPRKRANRQHGRVKSWPATDSDEVKVQGFAGWKAGMTHILMRDLNPYSPSAGAELRTAVTVVEVPPIRVLAVRGYHMTPYGLQTAGESWADSDSLDENVVGLFPRLANRSKAESLPEGYKPAKRAGRQPKPKNHDADANHDYKNNNADADRDRHHADADRDVMLLPLLLLLLIALTRTTILMPLVAIIVMMLVVTT